MVVLMRAGELLVFGALTVHAVRTWRRRRSPAPLWLACTFGSISFVTAIGFLPEAKTPRGLLLELYIRGVVTLLLLIPYFLHRLTTAFGTVSPRTARGVMVAAAITVAPALLGPPLPGRTDAQPAWLAVYRFEFMAYWTALTVMAVWRLWSEGRGQPRLARRRMSTLAVGSLVLNAAILLSGFSPRGDAHVVLAIQAIGLISGLVFYLGFVVPAPLRARWRRPEMDALRRGEAELMMATTTETAARAILPHAAACLGGGASAVLDADRRPRATFGDIDAEGVAARLPAAPVEPGTVLEVGDHLVVLALHFGWLAVQTSSTAPFFGREDTDLLVTLGHLLDLALERALLFDQVQTTCADLTERERQLGEAQHIAHIGSYEMDLETRDVRWSEEMYRILDLPRHVTRAPEMEEFLQRVHPEDRAALRRAANAAQRGERFESEYRVHTAGGSLRWVRGSGQTVDRDGHQVMVGTLQDITDQKEAEERLAHQAVHDALTGLPNRVLLMDRLAQALARNLRSGARCGVLFLDLDRFKSVNDLFGHAVGDELLATTARRLQGLVRPGDTVARLGGDEFVVVVEDIGDAAAAIRFADRMARVVAEPIALLGREIVPTCSIGIAVAEDGSDGESMMRDADMAMYRAKERGRARVEVFDARLRSEVVERIEIERALRVAIVSDQLVLHFQPSLSLATSTVVGIEALVRWNHPTRGLVAPSEFIAVAEQSGQVEQLGEWVLREACRVGAQLQERYRAGTPTVWVNVSAHQLRSGGLPGLVASAVAASGLSPSRLGLELTESALMESGAAVGDGLAEIRAMGVHLAIDDFGTGFSSLSYLRRYPFDLLKIDRSFVNGLGVDSEDSAIVSACVALAHSLAMPAVAEGVETPEQLRALGLLGCDLVQGHLFAMPVPAEELPAMLDRLQRSSTPVGDAARRPLVLVCDDEPSVRLLLRVALEGVGADVLEVAGAEACIATARASVPDLVFLDVVMPGRDGLWALEQLHDALPQVPVLLVTAAAEHGLQQRAAGLGAVGCIDKLGVLDRLPEILGALELADA